ncbi:AMP-binding protein [Thermus brockianus]|jgi:acetyl-CoA synthetase|uniref:acetate--CoA ligase n=1 Tax=Thermus brockianus TaxID=56956 RepID=A0A1J0LQH5_THEBO|nr:AMP-binding protein [Thermus brockianus]APD08542.1 acetyl-coenzyme A synthetase [Thermus brockianus]
MEPVWYPDPKEAQNTRLYRFMEALGFQDYEAFYRYSVEEAEDFYRQFLAHLGIPWRRPYERVVEGSFPLPRFFVGGRLNLADAVFRHPEDRLALLHETEDGQVRALTYGELRAEVARVAAGLRALGVGRGERVGLWMPMGLEAATLLLATSWLGAIAIPIFSGYAAEAAAIRLKDAEARLLAVQDGFLRRGRRVELLPEARKALALSGTERLLVVRRLGLPLEGNEADYAHLGGEALPPEEMESMDPFMLIYTSGTTGRPKGTVHYHAGFPLKAALDMALLFDLREEDRLFWFTDLGWMMGPWAILGGLILGGTVFLYDGAPDYPGPERLWRMVEAHRLTHLGLSPTLVRALIPFGEAPIKAHDLSSLRVLGSTGEPWNLDPYLWFFRTVGEERRPIVNYSGGTEISGGILGNVLLRPIKPMGFNTAVPGMKAAILDEAGRPVKGQVGELAVLAPWPGMTKGFWRDEARYLDTYFAKVPGVWVHGDFALLDEEGHYFILGRSDDTLKVAGKRVGPAEVETAALNHPALKEAAAIGVPHPVKGEAIVLFAVLKPGIAPNPELAEAVAEKVAEALGRPLKPERVLFVPDLPKTRNAKVMRRVVRAAYLGQDPGDLSALENPEAVEAIRRAARGG